jgi:hypothetical protein
MYVFELVTRFSIFFPTTIHYSLTRAEGQFWNKHRKYLLHEACFLQTSTLQWMSNSHSSSLGSSLQSPVVH